MARTGRVAGTTSRAAGSNAHAPHESSRGSGLSCIHEQVCSVCTWKGELQAPKIATMASLAAVPASSSLLRLLPVTMTMRNGKASTPSCATFCLQAHHKTYGRSARLSHSPIWGYHMPPLVSECTKAGDRALQKRYRGTEAEQPGESMAREVQHFSISSALVQNAWALLQVKSSPHEEHNDNDSDKGWQELTGGQQAR